MTSNSNLGGTPCRPIARSTLNRRRLLAGAAATTTLIAAPSILRAQGAALKVGVLLPRSGAQASIGQDCQRGVDVDGGHPQAARHAQPADHERRHRDQRRGGARPRREADQRRRAASGRRLRFRPVDRDRPGGRAEGHSLRHQHRRGAADHRAGLQVRVPQLPDRADDPRATPSRTRRRCSRPPASRRRPWCSCTSTTPSAPRCRRASARSCRSSTCRTRSRRRSPTTRRRATCRSKSPRPRRPAPTRCSRSAGSTTRS